MEDNYFSVKEVAKRFKVSTSSIYRLIREDLLECVRIRRSVRITVEEVIRYEEILKNNDKILYK